MRIPSKPFLLHILGCRFSWTATCTCGMELNYSPAKRIARGEIDPVTYEVIAPPEKAR